MHRSARLVAIVCALAPLAALADSCIWYTDDDSIRQVRSSTNQVTVTVPLKASHRLAMNAEDCGVWALNKEDKRLLLFGPDGTSELDIDVRSVDPALDEVKELQIDPYDGTVWIADNKRVDHLSPAGERLAAFPVPGELRKLRVALDQSLWILGERNLWHFDGQGTLLASYPLAEHSAADAKHFEIDSLGGLIWLVGEHEVSQLLLSNPSVPPLLLLRLPDHITGLTIDPLSGTLWIAQKTALASYSRAGALVRTVDLEPLGVRKPKRLGFDPASRSLWLGAERSVVRITGSGDFVVRFAARDGDEALGVPAFRVQPTLTLVRPPADALSNNPFLQFTLAYGAQCNGEPCPFGNEYFNAYTLDATLNGQAIGAQFAFDPATAQASFTPAARLPEGMNTFHARAKDAFGHLSNVVATAFTIDTIAPKFLTLTPADGSVLPSPNVVIQGTTDDPTATVALGASGFSQTGASFAFPVVLQPGLNTFNLSATDRAGNVTVTTLRLSLVTVTVTVASPVDGAAIAGDSITVTGTLQGPVNTGVTVNGLVATVTGTGFIAPNVPLQTGANTLTVVAATPDGHTATRTVSVTSTGSAPIHVTASVAQGVAPLRVTFSINNSSANAIQAVFIDFNGTGAFFNFGAVSTISSTYTPGTYQVGFIINGNTGTQYRQTVTIVAQDPAQIDQTLRASWGGFTSALATRDTVQALQYLSVQSRSKYGPVFEALKPNLPQIVANFAPIAQSTISDGLGEYAVKRTNASGVTNLYFIYFVRDKDGVWRLDSM